MSIEIAKYTFLSWLRRGIANSIAQKDTLGTGVSGINERSSLPVDITLNGVNIHKDFALIGPGDIIGINPSMVVRTCPLHWISNFEPNYLSFLEYYDEDFCWRYTPASPNGDRLRPWIVLLVLKEAEFVRNDKKLPLPTVTLQSKECLPPFDQSWSWAHVHINRGFDHPDAFEAFLESLNNLNEPNADHIISRLMSPRRLQASTNYHAFVVPAFETGRQAGLGQPVATIDAQKPSWDNDSPAGLELPFYYEWFFRTGVMEDFQFLAEQLIPRTMDPKVGIRDMDVSEPGFGLDTGANPPILGLEGALKSPFAVSTVFPLLPRHTKDFQVELQAALNFPDAYQKSTNNSEDPVVSAPIYGENHALQHTIDISNDGWLNALNRDPRNRVPAGFGTSVLQKNQEDYVTRAWQQVKTVLGLNQSVKFTFLGVALASSFKKNFTDKISTEQFLLFSAPLFKKVKGSLTTLHFQLSESLLPAATISAAMRRLTRGRGSVNRRLGKSGMSFSQGKLIQRLNEGSLSAAPAAAEPQNLTTDKKLADELSAQTTIPPPVKPSSPGWLVRHRTILLVTTLMILAAVLVLTGAWALVVVLASFAVAGFFYLNSLSVSISSSSQPVSANDPSAGIALPASMLSVVKNAPAQPNFRLTVLNTTPGLPVASGTKVIKTTESTSSGSGALVFNQTTYFTPGTGSATDSVEAANFRKAATDLYSRLSVSQPIAVRASFNILNAETKLKQATDPLLAYSRQLKARYRFPFNAALLQDIETLVPAMAYPDFSDPMYLPLRDISPELLIPNLNLIPPDTISLLLTNPPFIESYMVGLNHEMGRELLWREYPTDERGSYFRQFWDTKGLISDDSEQDQAALADLNKDILPIDTWTHASLLGDHKKRDLKNPDKRQLVLVIRGELLKRYPNTIIYAQKAQPALDANGVPIPGAKPVITDVVTKVDMDTEIKFPLFHAEVAPDIKFFGFDLTLKQASGQDPTSPFTDNLGWYFVIQQMPGEPIFGMEIELSKTAGETSFSWNDLSWDVYDAAKKFIDMNSRPLISFSPVSDDRNKWGSSASNMAYILYREPVMVAVHASQMLEGLNK